MKKPKYRRHTVRNLGFAQFNGKRHYFPGAYKSQESLRAYNEFIRKNVNPALNYLSVAPPAQDAITVGDIALKYLRWAEQQHPGERSEFANVRAAIKHLLATDAATRAVEFGPLRLKALQSRLATSTTSRSYVNAVCSKVKRMFKWAASEELVPVTVFQALQTVAGLRVGKSLAKEPAKRLPVSWEHVDAVLQIVSPTIHAMMLLQWLTGARSQSICEARPHQFKRSANPWEWRPKHKTEATHDVLLFIGPQAQAVLSPFLEGKGPQDYLFNPRHLNGRPAKGYRSMYDATSYRRAITRAIERINKKNEKSGLDPMPLWTPHQMRHARATLVRAKHGLEAAQSSMGHATLDATQIYAQAQRELARTVAIDMG